MNKALSTIEEELNWIIKEYKATTDHTKNKHLESLAYHIHFNKKKIKIIFQFLFMPREESLVLKIVYQIRDNQRELHEKVYPFSKIKDDLSLPMINEYDYQRINDVMDYELDEGKIKSVVSPLTQAVTYTEVIRRNISDIIKYGKQLKKDLTSKK